MQYNLFEKSIRLVISLLSIIGSLLIILVIELLVRARIFTLDQVFSYFNMPMETDDTNTDSPKIIRINPPSAKSQKTTTNNKIEYTPQKPKPIKPPITKSPIKPGWRKRDVGIKPRESGRK